MRPSASQLIAAAQAEGLLPPEAGQDAPPDQGTSWIVAASSFVGAQLVVLPFVVFLGLLLPRGLQRPPGLFLVAAVLLLAALVLLRRPRAMFVQQLGFGLLLSGLAVCLLGWRPRLDNMVLLALLALVLAAALAARADWVQRALGFLSAGLALLLILPGQAGGADATWWRLFDPAAPASRFPALANLALLGLAWAGWCVREPATSRWRLAARGAALADGLGTGLLLACAWASLDPLGTFFGSSNSVLPPRAWRAASLLLVALGLVWLARHWRLPATLADPRSRLLALTALALLVAAWFVPRVGAVALLGAVAAGTGRRRTLGLALGVLLAQLASFYHALAWTLAHKAVLLASVGAGLALLLWIGRDRAPRPATPPAASRMRARGWPAALIAAGLLLALGLVQRDVQRKEAVIASGQRIYVALAPVDPRSILQGDYMALNFRLPPQIRQQLADGAAATRTRPLQVLARLDARGIASVERLAAPGEAADPGQVLLPLRLLKHGWTLVTDAYHFPEGQEPRFRQARYGEFRVLPGGQALLVGLADAGLQRIDPAAPAR